MNKSLFLHLLTLPPAHTVMGKDTPCHLHPLPRFLHGAQPVEDLMGARSQAGLQASCPCTHSGSRGGDLPDQIRKIPAPDSKAVEGIAFAVSRWRHRIGIDVVDAFTRR